MGDTIILHINYTSELQQNHFATVILSNRRWFQTWTEYVCLVLMWQKRILSELIIKNWFGLKLCWS